MAEYIAALAPSELPNISYARINAEQAEYVRRAMQDPENQRHFDVAFLPVTTPDQRRAAAEEWAGYEQVKGHAEAAEAGAVFIFNSQDRSPEAFVALLEDRDIKPETPWVTYALLKVINRTPGISDYELLRNYYVDPK